MGYETVCVWSSPSFLLLRLDLSPKAKFFKSSSNLKLPSFHFLFIEKLTFYIVQRKTLSEFSDSWIFFPFLLGAREGGTVKPPLTATSLQTPPCMSRRIYYAFTLILTSLKQQRPPCVKARRNCHISSRQPPVNQRLTYSVYKTPFLP